MAELIPLAQAADRCDFAAMWISDEPFYRGALPAAAACAAATDNLLIGLGVVNPFEHPPVALARDVATLQESAGGRAILGLGAGWRPPVEAQGLIFQSPLDTVRDALAIVRPLLRNERLDYVGRSFSVSQVQLSFINAYPATPVYIASMFPKSLRQTGAIADGVLLSILCPSEYVRRARNIIEEGAKDAGRSMADLEVVQYLLFNCHEDSAQAVALMKRELARFIRHSYDPEPAHWAKVAELGSFDLDEFAQISRHLAIGRSPEESITDSFVRQFSVAGNPSECIDGLSRFADAGMDQAALVFPSGLDARLQIDTIHRSIFPAFM
jgi:5,10-methylenetetrahydromethanopterin reductase